MFLFAPSVQQPQKSCKCATRMFINNFDTVKSHLGLKVYQQTLDSVIPNSNSPPSNEKALGALNIQLSCRNYKYSYEKYKMV